ncbi:MAG TPA: hypothetical protein VE999_08945 [Gemmataceae bacterium]|nr:hypothetical protein [Gemmataceae bacterium]
MLKRREEQAGERPATAGWWRLLPAGSRRPFAALLLCALCDSVASSSSPPSAPVKVLDAGNVLAALGGGSIDALAGSLRGVLVKSMPSPLYEDLRHWGLQKPVPEIKWRGKGVHVHPERIEVMKNDGRWWKVRVTADRLPDTLVFDLRDARVLEPGRMTFTAFVSFDTHVEYDKQTWHGGRRTYSGSTRARLRVKLTLHCEATARLDGSGGLLPDAVFRLRVLQAESDYDNFVVEHIAGLGGEAAKLLGDAARGSIKQWRPSMERELLAKANAAIVKAGDTKEVHVSLSKLLGKKN